MKHVIYKTLNSYKRALQGNPDKHLKDVVVIKEEGIIYTHGIATNYTNFLTDIGETNWATKKSLPPLGNSENHSRIGDVAFTTDGTLYKQLGGEQGWTRIINLKGEQGQNGSNGSNGIDGKSPELQMQGDNLKWRYKGDKDWNDLGIVKGRKGDAGRDGTGVNIKGTIQNDDELPDVAEVGDAYIDRDGNLLIWVETGGDRKDGKYKDVGDIKGPKGDKGERGERGQDGERGLQGERGTDGYSVSWDESQKQFIINSQYVGPQLLFTVKDDNRLYLGETPISNSLKGEKGADGQKGEKGQDAPEFILEWEYPEGE